VRTNADYRKLNSPHGLRNTHSGGGGRGGGTHLPHCPCEAKLVPHWTGSHRPRPLAAIRRPAGGLHRSGGAGRRCRKGGQVHPRSQAWERGEGHVDVQQPGQVGGRVHQGGAEEEADGAAEGVAGKSAKRNMITWVWDNARMQHVGASEAIHRG
jgi:hypothetical protein